MNNQDNADLGGLIEKLRKYLSRGIDGQEAAFAADMKLYSDISADANQRLRECFELSSKGRYANAIALADRDPNLLERCSILSFPGCDALRDASVVAGIPEPEMLNRILVDALDETYRKGSTVQSELAQLRRLTLARAPIPSRLAVMRRIHVKDPNHPFLEEDIRQFELTWFRRAPAFCREWADAGHGEVIEEAITDLTTSGYLETPPASLLETLQQYLARAQQFRLPALAEEIREAFDSRDQLRLIDCVEKWFRACADCGADCDDPQYPISAALLAVRRHKEVEKQRKEAQAAARRLETLLQTPKCQRTDLERGYAIATGSGPLAPELEQKYQQRIQQFERAALARKAGIVSALALTALGILVVAINWIQSNRHASQVVAFTAELRQKMDAGDFAGVLERISAKPDFSSEPSVRDLASAATAGTSRSRIIQEIRNAPLESDVTELETRAQQFAVSEDDRQQIQLAAADWRERRRTRQEELKQQFQESRRKLADELQKTNDWEKELWNPEFLEERLAHFDSMLAQIKSILTFPEIADGVSLKSEQERLTALRDLYSAATRMQKLITSAVSVPLSRSSLKQLAEDLQKAHNRRLMGTDSTSWEAVLELSNQLQSRNLRPEELSKWTKTPLNSVLDRARLELDRRTRRSSGSGGTDALKERLSRPDILGLYAVKAGEYSSSFYVREEPAKSDTPVSFNAVISKAGTILAMSLPIKEVEPAPQSRIAQQLISRLMNANEESWYADMTAVYEAFRSSPEGETVDPILRLELLEYSLSLCSSYSSGYSQIFDQTPEVSEILKKSRELTGSWMQPQLEESLRTKRAEAAKLCKSAPAIMTTQQQRAATIDQDNLRKAETCIVFAGLIDASASRLTVKRFSVVQAGGSGELFVIADGIWQAVGTCDAEGRYAVKDSAIKWIGYPVIQVTAF